MLPSPMDLDGTSGQVDVSAHREKAKLAPTAPPMPLTSRPPVDRPFSAPTSSVTSTPSSLAADVAAVEVNPEAFEIFRQLVPDGTEDDFRKQRYAMQQDEKTLGKAGLRKVGGYPICDMDEIKTGFYKERR